MSTGLRWKDVHVLQTNWTWRSHPFGSPALQQTAPPPGYGVQFDRKASRDAALGGGPGLLER